MNGVPSRRAAAVVCLLFAAGLRAEEPVPPPAPAAASAEPGLIGAEQDFSAMRAHAPLPDRKVDLKLDLPTLSPAGPEAPRPKADPTVTLDANGRPKKPGSNWLVDAMAQSDPKHHPATEGRGAGKALPFGDEATSAESGATQDPLAPAGGDAASLAVNGAGPAASAKDAAEREHAAEAREAAQTNPLTPFMSSWISSADRSLLAPPNPGTAGSGGPSAAPVNLPGIENLDGPPGLAGVAPSDGALASLRPAGGDLHPVGNPYLEQELAALALPSSHPVLAPLAPVPGPAEILAPAAVPGLEPLPRSADPAHPTIPDFARPSDDDKYFKQMKRF